MNIRVYYEDTDLGGIVYHVNYIKFCERARSEIFFKKNIVPIDNEQNGFVVRNLKADFLAISTLGDLLNVVTSLIILKKTSLILQQEVWKGEVKLFCMEVTLVYIQKGRPARIPETFKRIFDSFNKSID